MTEPRVYEIDICELCDGQFGEGSTCDNCNGHWKRRTKVVPKVAEIEARIDELVELNKEVQQYADAGAPIDANGIFGLIGRRIAHLEYQNSPGPGA